MRISLAVLAVLFCGAVGAFLGYRLPVPAGVLVGALIGVGIAVGGGSELLGIPRLFAPSWVNGLLQVMLGIMVGMRMTRDSLRSGAHALVPATLLAAVLISTSVASALVAAPLASLDIVTALFAAAPGGMTEMSTVSVSFGADGAAVAVVQLVRVLLAVAIANLLLAKVRSKSGPRNREPRRQGEHDGGPDGRTGHWEDLKRLGISVPWGVAGGVVGILSGAPAGGIIGALICSAAFRLLTERPVPVKGFQLGVQALAGGVIGFGVSGEFFGQLARLAGAGALILSVQMLLWLATAWLLAKLLGYDRTTAALASSPGGMSDVVASADQGGADVVIVTFIHLVRLSSIVIVVPVLVAVFFSG